MESELLRRAPLIFVEDLSNPVLETAAAAHLSRSLRMRPGDSVNVSDGVGSWAPARLSAVDGDVEIAGEVRTEPEPALRLCVGFTPTKGVRPEGVVQKLTELGVHEITILQSSRSIVTYDDVRAERLLRKIATTVREASQQCRQPRLPIVHGPVTLDRFLATDPKALLCDPAGRPFPVSVSPDQTRITLAIGPEGGWSPAEFEAAQSVALPGRILRAETATIAAGVMAAALGGRPRSAK